LRNKGKVVMDNVFRGSGVLLIKILKKKKKRRRRRRRRRCESKIVASLDLIYNFAT